MAIYREEKMFAIHRSGKEHISRRCKGFLHLNNGSGEKPYFKMGKRLELTLHQKDTGMVNMYMKRCPISVVIREM